MLFLEFAIIIIHYTEDILNSLFIGIYTFVDILLLIFLYIENSSVC